MNFNGANCAICKTNKAAYYIVDILHGNKTESYLCEPCLNKFDTSGFLKLFALPIDQIGMLTGFSNNDIKCESCGMTLSKFVQTKRVGCAKDYDLFNLGPLLESHHKASKHVGKVPANQVTQETISNRVDHLNKSMAEAIKSEKYEEAARIRDEIKNLKGN